MALESQHGLRRLIRPSSSAWPLLVTGAMNISSDPGCYRAMDQDIALGSSPNQMTSWLWVKTKSHSDQLGPDSGTALKHPMTTDRL